MSMQGRNGWGPPPSASIVTRALNTAFQISASRAAMVSYSVMTLVTASIIAGQDGEVWLETADDQPFSVNVEQVCVAPASQTYTLAIALQGVQKSLGNLFGFIAAGKWVRIRTNNLTGAPAYTWRTGQETLI